MDDGDWAEVRRLAARAAREGDQKLWADVKLEVRELRDELESLRRVLDERTGHLA